MLDFFSSTSISISYFPPSGGNDLSQKPHLVFNTAAIPGADGDKDTCPRCGGMVFHAEKMLSKSAVSIYAILN